jgi:hypothetical protein
MSKYADAHFQFYVYILFTEYTKLKLDRDIALLNEVLSDRDL